MAHGHNRPLTTAANNFFRNFNLGQARKREEARAQAVIEAAETRREQLLDDREDLALAVEEAIGIDIGDEATKSSIEPRAVEDGIIEEDITRGGITIPSSPTGTERRGPGRVGGLVFRNARQRKAFSEAVANNPSVSGPILNFLSKSNEFQLKQESNRTGRLLRGGIFLQNQQKKSPVRFQEGIKQLVESGLYSENEVRELVSLSNEPNQDLVDLKLEKLVLDNTPKKILLEEEIAKRKEERAVKPGFTLSPGQRRFGPAGKEIARVEAAPPTPETRTTLAKNLELAGIDPKSAEGIKIIKESITKPGVKIDLNKGLDFKIPTGFQLLDPNNPTKGVQPIPGGPKDNLTAENAAKAQMLRTAQKAAKGIDKFVFDKDGSLNRTNLFNASFGTPGTDGRELRNKMEFGIQAITRSETGAAMPESEVDNTRQRFMPSVLDSVKTAKLKLQMFNEFISGTLKLLDPTGRFQAVRFNEVLINRGGEGEAPAINQPEANQPQRNIVVDF